MAAFSDGRKFAMPRNRNLDIIIEMVELIDALIKEVRQDLGYFRVSVYKNETATLMGEKIEKLRFVAALFPEPALIEPFHDYDAEVKNALANYIPGECSYTARTTRLLNGLEEQIARLRISAGKTKIDPTQGEQGLTIKIRQCRTELMSICRHGSRHWTFFQGL
jgi:hypothetical protein